MYSVTAKNAPELHASHSLYEAVGGPSSLDIENSFGSLGALIACESKQSLFWEGDSAEYIYKVVRGVVCLYKLLPDGRRQVARFCCAGDLLGLGQRAAYQYTADTVTPVTLIRVRRADLDAELETNTGLRNELLAAVSDELRAAQDQLVLLGRKSAIERVASFIAAMAEQSLRQGDNAQIVDLPMTRVDIADYLGLTHETVCRAFSQLKVQGILNIHDHHLVEIRKPDTLDDIATGEGAERLCA
jgi:CRP/FNR family transcriptional regulator